MKILTKAEEQVMQALWQSGGGFLKDILDEMPEPKPHSNTVATILKILIEKGFVRFEAQGRNNYYSAAIGKQAYGNSSLKQVVNNYFEGNPASMVSHFVKNDSISVEELEALLQQIKSSGKA